MMQTVDLVKLVALNLIASLTTMRMMMHLLNNSKCRWHLHKIRTRNPWEWVPKAEVYSQSMMTMMMASDS